MCKCVACSQLVTVMNCVNISDCDYVDSDKSNIDLALEDSEVRVAPRDQENIRKFVGMLLRQNLHRHFCS
jgi:hypothetical protein